MADISIEISLGEAYRQPNGGYEVTLIEAGQYDSKVYPAHVLQRAAPLFEGIQAFADQPTEKQKRERPEGSIRDLAGFYENVRFENGRLKGTLRLIEGTGWLQELIEKAPGAIGIRVNCDGKTHRDYSKSIDVVESIDSIFSADIVTGSVRTGKIAESRKEVKKMSKYHIGTLLPEAKRAWLELNLKEGEPLQLLVESDDETLSVRQEGAKGKPYHIGTLLPEAKRAWIELNLKESS